MVGISEVIQTLGAMIIFSLILLTSNQMIQNNSFHEVETESENIAVTLGQNIIEEAQTKVFDANTDNGNIPVEIPGGFSSCGPGSGENRRNFNDFDDYDGYSEDVDTKLGTASFHIRVAVSYVSPPDYEMSSGSKAIPTNFKKMVVTVTSKYLKDNREIRLSYLRQYYKTRE